MNDFIYGTHPQKWEDVKICTYVISKNELKHVDTWLKLIWNGGKGSDYICVLDTGSTDGTYEKFQELAIELNIPTDRFILKQQIFENFRFDDARNASMELIPNENQIDVCFCVDLDEYVNVDFWDDLRKVVFEHPEFQRIYYRYEQKPGVIFWYDKIHGVKNWKWRECVHEILYTNDNNYSGEYYLDETKIYLVHHADPSKNRKFYLSLLKQREKENQTDPYGVFYIGAVLSQEEGLYAEAIPYFEKTILLLKDFNDGIETLPMAYLNLGRCYSQLPDCQDLTDYYFRKAITLAPKIGNAYIDFAQYCAYTGRPEMARQILKEFDENAVNVDAWYKRTYVWSKWKRCQLEGDILCWEGKYQEAYEVFKEGLKDITDSISEGSAIKLGFFNDYHWVENKIKEIEQQL